ncbi:putative threonine efflux protein [Bernardetia litoralis DSM 6794]|uniref:Putative threonine efflux protein n=1 Tax=Bernardetia litoralis (strain ATCC 23117 / DSM 6794 / NBRC 15988 / NCIMB 1366 / Fx l1 / Sio-4) TaxID=880071 RepID=I4APW8_BERLS|nr:LysE family translocator [Bernardetia litoralis]AFM06003.1 putative threonine efflux protein [Bernardetia litoralis DSM 6794]
MELELVLSFLGTSIILALMPGSDNLFVLTESLTKGQKDGIFISLGLSLGVFVHTFAAATGLSIVIQKSTLAFSILKYLGAAYLFYLAFMSFKEQKIDVSLESNSKVEETKLFPLVKKGFLMNVLNPKVSLFFIAFLPQFITSNGYNVTLQMIILGFIFMLQAFLIFSMIAILASKLTKYVNNPKFWKITKWCKIIILSMLGLVLIFSEK